MSYGPRRKRERWRRFRNIALDMLVIWGLALLVLILGFSLYIIMLATSDWLRAFLGT